MGSRSSALKKPPEGQVTARKPGLRTAALALLLSCSTPSWASDRIAWFAWDSKAVLEHRIHDAEIRDRRVFIAFTPAQIAEHSTKAGRLALRARLDSLKDLGVQPWLLIGEPNFFDARYLGSLFAIFEAFQDLGLHGVALDVEREGVHEEEWAASYAKVLREAAGVLDVPLAAVVHHKDALVLAEIGGFAPVDEVILMAYATAPGRAAMIAETFAIQNPGVRVSLAQSFEPDLPAENSWLRKAGTKEKAFQQMLRENQKLFVLENFSEIVLESIDEAELMANNGFR